MEIGPKHAYLKGPLLTVVTQTCSTFLTVGAEFLAPTCMQDILISAQLGMTLRSDQFSSPIQVLILLTVYSWRI